MDSAFWQKMDTMTPEAFQDMLTGAYGSYSDHLKMDAYAHKSGTYGLDGFISHIVNPLIDNPPLGEDSRYEALWQTVLTMCAALTRKLRNFAKVYSRNLIEEVFN